MRDEYHLLDNDDLLTLKQAAASLPLRNGKRPHVATLRRWRSKGLRGIRLQTVRGGGIVYTSHQALRRFFDAVTKATDAQSTPSAATPSPSRQPSIAAAEIAGKQLERAWQ